MFVEAKDEYAAQFYERLGFLPAEGTDGRQRLFFPVNALATLFPTAE